MPRAATEALLSVSAARVVAVGAIFERGLLYEVLYEGEGYMKKEMVDGEELYEEVDISCGGTYRSLQCCTTHQVLLPGTAVSLYP